MSYRRNYDNRDRSGRSLAREDGDNTRPGWRATQSGGKINIQDAFLNHCRREKITVDIKTINGDSWVGTIAGFDPSVIALEKNGSQQLVFKTAIVLINPVDSVNYIFNEAYHHEGLRTHTEYTDDFA